MGVPAWYVDLMEIAGYVLLLGLGFFFLLSGTSIPCRVV
jgi:hypothetical protein